MYLFFAFLMNDTATTEIYTYSHTLSLHDALPISFGHGEAAENIHRSKDDGHKAAPFGRLTAGFGAGNQRPNDDDRRNRSEEHTSELQSLMRIWYAVFILKNNNKHPITNESPYIHHPITHPSHHYSQPKHK